MSTAGGAASLPSDGVLPPVLFFRGDGTKIANKPPAKPPLRALGRSRWPLSSPCRNAATGSEPPRRYSRSSASLWPSKIGMRLGEVTALRCLGGRQRRLGANEVGAFLRH